MNIVSAPWWRAIRTACEPPWPERRPVNGDVLMSLVTLLVNRADRGAARAAARPDAVRHAITYQSVM
ncbi:hypothetical protein GCM10022205_42890 [Spinactinospora alkalitolerans]